MFAISLESPSSQSPSVQNENWLVDHLAPRLASDRERDGLKKSLADHVRNGRGFWPVVTVDGTAQVVRFSGDTDDALCGHARWNATTGIVELVPLHALPVADWPRVRLN